MYHLSRRQNESTNALYSYSDKDAALTASHTELAYRVEGRTSTRGVICDEYGNTVKKEIGEAAASETQE